MTRDLDPGRTGGPVHDGGGGGGHTTDDEHDGGGHRRQPAGTLRSGQGSLSFLRGRLEGSRQGCHGLPLARQLVRAHRLAQGAQQLVQSGLVRQGDVVVVHGHCPLYNAAASDPVTGFSDESPSALPAVCQHPHRPQGPDRHHGHQGHLEVVDDGTTRRRPGPVAAGTQRRGGRRSSSSRPPGTPTPPAQNPRRQLLPERGDAARTGWNGLRGRGPSTPQAAQSSDVSARVRLPPDTLTCAPLRISWKGIDQCDPFEEPPLVVGGQQHHQAAAPRARQKSPAAPPAPAGRASPPSPELEATLPISTGATTRSPCLTVGTGTEDRGLASTD